MISSEFQPTGKNLTSEQMKVGYWYVTHKLLLRRIFILIFLTINIVLLLITIYGFFDFYVLRTAENEQMVLEITSPKLDYAYLYEIGSAQPLLINFTDKLASNNDKYDFVAEVQNVNSTWYASKIVYHFEANNYVGEIITDYILPGQTKYLMSLGQDSGNSSAPALVIDQVVWKKQADYEKLQPKILNFEVSNEKFTASSQNEASQTVPINILEYSIVNNSAYNFWDVNAKILLFRNNQLLSVNEVAYDRFDSGETKDTQYLIYNNLATPNKIIIQADVDILNPESFRGFDGQGQAK